MKGSTAVVIVAGLALAGFAYYLYQKKNSQLTIGANGLTGQINLSQAAGALGGLFSGVSNLFKSNTSSYTGTGGNLTGGSDLSAGEDDGSDTDGSEYN